MAIELNSPLSDVLLSEEEDTKQTLTDADISKLREVVGPSVLRELIRYDHHGCTIREMLYSGRLCSIRNVGPAKISKICAALGLRNPYVKKKRTARSRPSEFDATELIRGLQPEPMRFFAGIYILYLDGVVKYVGQSVNVVYRVSQHIGVKPFNEVKTIAVRHWTPQSQIPHEEMPELQAALLSIEACLINHFKPEWNG